MSDPDFLNESVLNAEMKIEDFPVRFCVMKPSKIVPLMKWKNSLLFQ